MEKDLLFFTSEFPFGKSETFIENEISLLAKYFSRVYIFPAIQKEGKRRKIPKNCIVVGGLFSDVGFDRKKTFIKHFHTISKLFLSEYNNFSKTDFVNLLSSCNRMVYKSIHLEKFIIDNKLENAVFYTYWMEDWTTILSILSHRGVINKFISRAHGFDLFEERQKKGFIRFRRFQLKHITKVYSVSNEGKNYLQGKFSKFSEKIDVSYLGTKDYGMNSTADDGMVHLVSISNMIPLKRLELIIEVLKFVKVNAKWTHIGDGKEMETIKSLSIDLPKNIEVVFKGQIKNKTVLQFLKNESISFLINVSITEGLPVSIMEAISFGIPVIATNVGGTKEIVNEDTGVLISPNFRPSDVSEYLNNFNNSNYFIIKYREAVREFWSDNFNEKINYSSFIRKILDIGNR